VDPPSRSSHECGQFLVRPCLNLDLVGLTRHRILRAGQRMSILTVQTPQLECGSNCVLRTGPGMTNSLSLISSYDVWRKKTILRIRNYVPRVYEIRHRPSAARCGKRVPETEAYVETRIRYQSCFGPGGQIRDPGETCED
jgi:hypothetical protein